MIVHPVATNRVVNASFLTGLTVAPLISPFLHGTAPSFEALKAHSALASLLLASIWGLPAILVLIAVHALAMFTERRESMPRALFSLPIKSPR